MSSLANQKEMNIRLMEILQENGVYEGEMRVVDYFYFTKRKQAAKALCDDLKKRLGYDATVNKQGWFRPTYCVTGTARVNATLADLNSFCETMWKCGEPHGIEFDGWGAQV